MFLLDTCVLSDGVQQRPNPNVLTWLRSTPDDDKFVSVLSLAEIQFGILRLPEGKRKRTLSDWYVNELRPSCGSRVLDFDERVALQWARLRAADPGATFVDTQIAATALVHSMLVVTRNVRDFEFEGLRVFNPWQP